MISTEKEKRDGGVSLFKRYHSIIADVPAFEAALNRPMDRFIRVNTLRIPPDRLQTILESDGYDLRLLPWHRAAFRVRNDGEGLGNHWAYLAGLFHIQEASAMIPPLLLAPKPGDRVLDLCAAPGNKTAQLALLLENRGTVVGNDIVSGRLRAMRAVVDRLGLINVCVTCYDGSNYPKSAGTFDAVIADVPCGCEGVSRQSSSVLSRTSSKIEALPPRQLLLLKQAVRRCRTGGRIVYSTCTYAPEENEAVVDALLREWPDQVRILPAAIGGMKTAPGLTRWEDRAFHPDLAKTLRIWPHLNDTAGFYAALLEKTGAIGNVPGNRAASDTEEGTIEGDPLPPETGLIRGSDRASVLAHLRDRYGIPASTFDRMILTARGNREIRIIPEDHRPALLPERAMGIPLIHIRFRFNQLSTAGAGLLGPLGARNTVDLDAGQLERYLLRAVFSVSPAQTRNCDDEGYVLIRHQGFGIGMGFFLRTKMAVKSLFPKRLALKSEKLTLQNP